MPSRKDAGNEDDTPDRPASNDSPLDVAESEEITTEDNTQGERSVAGRKKMKGGESKDVHSGSHSPMEKSKGKGEAQEEKKEKPKSREERELDAEMNSILKRGPSKSADRSQQTVRKLT